MFEIGRLFWIVAHPARIAFVVLCLGVILLFTRRWRLGRGLLALLLATSIGLGTIPVGDWLMQQLEQRFPPVAELPSKVDGIILLGGEINAAQTLATGQPVGRNRRLLAFAELAQRYPDARLVFSGGAGDLFDQRFTEAEAMPIALRAVGIDPARVTFENRSRNTRENALFTRETIKPVSGETWLLVTTAAHMPRAVGAFRKVNLPVVAYPVGQTITAPLSWWFFFTFDGGFRDLGAPLKEIYGLIAYRLFGYTDALFPAP